jgi:hypothetical protein
MVMHRLVNELVPPLDDEEQAPCIHLITATEEATARFSQTIELQEVSANVQAKAWEVVYDCLNLDEPPYRTPEYVRLTLLKAVAGLGCRSYDGRPNGLDESGEPHVRAKQSDRDTTLSYLAEALVNKDAISSVPVAAAIASTLAAGLDSATPLLFEQQKAAWAGQNRAKGFKLPNQYKRFSYVQLHVLMKLLTEHNCAFSCHSSCSWHRWCSQCGVVDLRCRLDASCNSCDHQFDSTIMVANPLRYLSQMLARRDLNGNAFVKAFKPDDDPMIKTTTASGNYYRALVERFGTETLYLGLTADGVDPMKKQVYG